MESVLFINTMYFDHCLFSKAFIKIKTGSWLNFTLVIIFIICFLFRINAQAVYPSLLQFTKPNPAPHPPGIFFRPPMWGSAAANTPACAEWTRSAGPDESVVITGINFSNYSGAKEGKDTRFLVYDENGIFKEAAIQRLDDNKVIVTLNKELAKWSMYMMWPRNETGYGNPITINHTDAWWIGPDKATRGSTISVYGRNLAQGNGTHVSYVYIKPTASGGKWATVTSVNPYKVEFIVPSSLSNGDYEVWIHNGHGGEYGWSGPLKMEVYNGQQWAGKVINVKDYGAIGDGNTDDTQALLTAIKTAIGSSSFNAGSTVYLPAGTYMVSNTLYLGPHLRIKGDGKNKTTIKCAADFSASAFGLLHAQGLSDIEVTDLALDGNNSYKGYFESPVYFRGDNDLSFNNMLLSFQNYNVFDLHASNHVTVSNCNVIGKYSFLGSCSQLFVDHCNFKLTNDAEMALHSWGGSEISITNSTCQDYDNTDVNNGAGWGRGRFFVGNGNWGSNRLTYIGNNVTRNLTVRPVGIDKNSGEQLMWEGNVTYASDSPIAATATTITFNESYSLDNKTLYAVIVRGKGLGQSRRIIATNGGTITVDIPWNVIPDQSSVVNTGNYVDRVAIYHNYLDGKRWASDSEEHNASAGIEPFGGAFNVIADNNIMHEVRTGISNWVVRVAGDKGVEPNFFNLYTNNRFIHCRWAILNVDGNFNGQTTEGTGILGTLYRKNVTMDIVEAGIKNTIFSSDYPIVDAVVYEHNAFNDVPAAFSSPVNGIQNQVLYHNEFSTKAPNASGSALNVTPRLVLRSNIYRGFDTTYLEYKGFNNGSYIQSSIIEAPCHVTHMVGSIGSDPVSCLFVLYNSGAYSVNWHATSSASWLTLSDTTGTIHDENAVSNIILSADPTGLPAGSYTADITVTGGDQIRTYTVLFTVSPEYTLNHLPDIFCRFVGDTTLKAMLK